MTDLLDDEAFYTHHDSALNMTIASFMPRMVKLWDALEADRRARIEALDNLRAELELANAQEIAARSERDRLRALLRHAAQRNHPDSDGCSACADIRASLEGA